MFQTGRYTALDLVGDNATCGSDCPAFIRRWSDWCRRQFGAALAASDVLSQPQEFLPWLADDMTEVVVAPTPLAMLEVPTSMAEYMDAIGPKPRNMIRKAHRYGYSYRPFDYNEYSEDVFAINTSKPVRVGGPMKQHYLTPPRPYIAQELCKEHCVAFLGGFRGDVLRAYVRLEVLNELAIINQFIGHGESLRDGVMNGLVHHIVDWCIAAGRVCAINYLGHASEESLARFKRSTGFRGRATAFRILCRESELAGL
jgi:hypothetical protein